MSEINPNNQPPVTPDSAPPSREKNPYTLWFVVASFVGPAVLAYSLYFFGDITSFTNKGEILDPIVHIRHFHLKDDNGDFIPTEKLTYKWRMISYLKSDCDEACKKRLHDSRQIYTSLGKHRHRVIRMFIHIEPPSKELNQHLELEHPNAIHVFGNEPQILSSLKSEASITRNEIYLMDPMGNVMMRFTEDQPNRDVLSDLKKLLKASQIG